MINEDDKRIHTLRDEEPYIAVLKLGIPLIVGMFIMVLYNLVDTYFIGLMHDDFRLAAVNLAYPVMMVTVAVSNMVGAGAASLIARSLGKGDKELAEHTVTAGIVLTVINAFILTVIGTIYIDKIVTGLGARSNTFGFTKGYVGILILGTVFTMGNYTLGQLLRSEGSVKYSIIGMIAGTVINIILDPVFIFRLGLGIKGAALATVLGNIGGTLLSIGLYLSGKTLLRPSVRYIKPTAEILKEIFWVGVPASLETLLTSVAYIVVNNLAVAYGELTVAAMGVAQKIMSVGNYIYQGFASGVQPLMGYNFGARQYSRMRSCFKAGLISVTTMELVVMLIYYIYAPKLIDIFTDTPEVIDLGAHVLRTIMFILPFVSAVSMTRMSFQAMGKPIYAFVITLVRQLILYVPLLIILNNIFGFQGMIWSQPLTEAIMMAVSIVLMLKVIKMNDVEE
ncbi:MAG: MATE family efflux transporter [Clostridiales bacterium]|nr:MATE family efflux transporter [Clostridiales bacterium]